VLRTEEGGQEVERLERGQVVLDQLVVGGRAAQEQDEDHQEALRRSSSSTCWHHQTRLVSQQLLKVQSRILPLRCTRGAYAGGVITTQQWQ
jgi:hypothetical protein